MNTISLTHDEVIALARAMEFYIEGHKQEQVVHLALPLADAQKEVLLTVFHLLAVIEKLPGEYEVKV